MNTAEFNDVVNTQIEHSTSVLIKKADEYASDTDRLANFKTAAVLQGITPAQALAGMMAKHTQSVYAMISSGQQYTEEMWDEKIGDHINYLLLLRAQVAEDGFKVNPNAVQAAPEEPQGSWEKALQAGEEPFPKPNMRKNPRVILDSEDGAYQVLDRMNELINKYGVATVGDFYDLIGADSVYEDNLFGWDRTISVATVTKVVEKNGYELHIPPAGPLPEFFKQAGEKFGKQAAEQLRGPIDISSAHPDAVQISEDLYEVTRERYEEANADQTALNDIARILSESNDWGSEEMTDIFHVVERVRKVKTEDPLDLYMSDVDIVPVPREDYHKHIEDQTALNDIARVLSNAKTMDEEEQSIFDIVQKVRVVEEDES